MGNEIKKGAIISYLAIIVNLIIGLLYTPWMIHEIGVSDYGLYSLVTAFLSYFILDFGLGDSVARFLSVALAKKNVKEAEDTINTALRIYLIIDAIILILLIIIFLFLSDIFHRFSPAEIQKFRVIYCIAGFFSVSSFPFMPLNGILISNEKFSFLKGCDLFQKLTTVALIIIALLCGGGLYMLVLVTGLTGFVIALVKYRFVKRKLDVKIDIKNSKMSTAKALFRFSMWVFIINIAHRLTLSACPTILGIESTTDQISIFSIAVMLEGHMWNMANALNGLFVPKVSSLSLRETSRKDISDLMIRVGRVQFIIMGLLLTGFFVFGRQFLVLWMGRSFVDSYFVAVLILAPGIITYTEAIGDTLLSVVNEIRWRAYLFIGAALTGCIISIFLATKYGAIGCGIGIFTSLLLCKTIGMNIVYEKVLGLDIKRFFLNCHLKLVWPLLIALVPVLIIHQFIHATNWLYLISEILIYAIVYSFSMWFMGMNVSEKDLIRLSFKKSLKKF